MRYAVLSDIHASAEALRAVLDDARAQGVDRVVCLGDVVGYHAEPDACVALLRQAGALCVAGNHDRVAAGLDEPSDFGDAARRAALWTRRKLSPESRAWLHALPLLALVEGRFLIVHGALHPAPNADLHLSTPGRVRRSLRALRAGPWGVRLAFFGHTHRGMIHEARSWGGVRSRSCAESAAPIPLAAGPYRLVNPGSVGQPRDGDARASYAILDAAPPGEELCLVVRRVPFDHEQSLAKAARAGLL